MTKAESRVVYLHRRDPQEALERLNRLTGLRFVRWPESLLAAPRLIESCAQERPEPQVAGSGP